MRGGQPAEPRGARGNTVYTRCDMRQRSLICLSGAILVLGLCFPSASAGPSTPKDGGAMASWLLGRAQQNLLDGRDNLMGRMTGGY
jgi:hypothetical protein